MGMDKLTELKIADAPHHGILPESWIYDLRFLRLEWMCDGLGNPTLDIDLSCYERYVKLRFFEVDGFLLRPNTIYTSVSLEIFDLRQYLPEIPAAIRVQGALEFWADDVVMR